MGDPSLAGDDCGVVEWANGDVVCASTDRVPWDLTANRFGLMSPFDMGYYLAVLNISDVAAMGGLPAGLLLNFALPADFEVGNLSEMIRGAISACDEFDCRLLGGDLSDSAEPSLCATVLGKAAKDRLLLRRGALPGDAVFVSDRCGTAASAFVYFRQAKPRGLRLDATEEAALREALLRPIPQIRRAHALAYGGARATAMDNTDGLSVTLRELAEASGVRFTIDAAALPLTHNVYRVAELVQADPLHVAMGPGADLLLAGTCADSALLDDLGMFKIGLVSEGDGVALRDGDAEHEIPYAGWDYFADGSRDYVP